MLLSLACLASFVAVTTLDRPRIDPVPFTAVKLTDTFWAPRIETTRTVTIPACFKQCESTGRIANFDRAAGKDASPHQGNCYDDSDVYKVMEGAAYSLASTTDAHLDRELDAYLDRLIARIAAAQEPDGYLYTIATANKRPSEARWRDEQWSHETYCAGHFFEAAVAHYQATGKRTMLDVATKLADLLVREFLNGPRKEVPGHQEVEIGLVRLYRVTGTQAYLDLARHFLTARGRADGRQLYGEYAQDHLPLVAQTKAVGHAVRAGYLYTAMADVAAITGETTFDAALDAIWADCVGTKLHITGGIGALASNEGFGDSYDLPNEGAYLETCAAIANCLWNQRMFLRSGSSAPIDVLERTLYNGVLAGVSLGGDRFFYPNPLACDGVRPFNHGTLGRAPWFGCACCPVNVARFLPSIAGYLYATSPSTIYANLYVSSEASIELGGSEVRLTQRSEFPWSGRVSITVDPNQERSFTLAVRIPGWVRGKPVPSDLYGYLTRASGSGPTPQLMWVVSVNGEPLNTPKMDNGYVPITRVWKKGDVVGIAFPMEPRRVVARDEVTADRGRVALECGPLVYCVEGTDVASGVRLGEVLLSDDARISSVGRPDLVPGVPEMRALALSAARSSGGGLLPIDVTAIPYFVWANRDVGEMRVWLPRDAQGVDRFAPNNLASPLVASASHCYEGDTVRAVNDGRVPTSKADESIARLTFWPHKGSAEAPSNEWVEYRWNAPTEIATSTIHFFDDTGRGGGCGLPSTWRLLIEQNGQWVPLTTTATMDADGVVKASFAKATTSALRLEVTLAKDRSAGVLEWTVD